MLRSQRIMATVGLPLLALLLHVMLCDWVWRQQLAYQIENNVVKYAQRPIAAWEPGRSLYSGLVTQPYVDSADAIVFGIALPAAMLLTLAYVSVGWRRDGRRARNLCVSCGYDLRGDGTKQVRCPE